MFFKTYETLTITQVLKLKYIGKSSQFYIERICVKNEGKSEKVDDVEVLDLIVEKGAKGAIIKLKEITEKLSKDITKEEKLKLLNEKNENIKSLQKYLENKLLNGLQYKMGSFFYLLLYIKYTFQHSMKFFEN